MDRFSDLPDEISHHILSFLDITSLARFGRVSKRCIGLQLSTPKLNFNRVFRSSSNRQQLLNYLSSLDRFLIQRGDNKIESFALSWQCSFNYNATPSVFGTPSVIGLELFQIIPWIYSAVRCNVEVLRIEINLQENRFKAYEGRLLEFPCCVFLCESVRSLSVKMNCAVLKSPMSSSSSSNLVSMRLTSVTVEEGFYKWISCCCKCIKELCLDKVKGIQNITIESSSLESFVLTFSGNLLDVIKISAEKLERLDISWSCDLPIGKSFIMYAPNLKYLSWEGNVMNDSIHLGKLLRLEKVFLCLSDEVDDLDSVFKFLCSIRSVKFLSLDDETIQVLCRKGPIPVTLLDVRFLCVDVGNFIENQRVQALVSLLRGIPNLNTFYVRSHDNYSEDEDVSEKSVIQADASGFSKRYWELQNLACISQLKEVIIELDKGYNGIEFARYLLEHAQNLEKIILSFFPEQQPNSLKTLNESKMVSNAEVAFQDRNEVTIP